MISNAGQIDTSFTQSRMMTNTGLSEFELKDYARGEYRVETPEHLAFQFENSESQPDSIIKMRQCSALLSTSCRTHGYYASACMMGFAFFGCGAFLFQFTSALIQA
jgi:hypothetical protein